VQWTRSAGASENPARTPWRSRHDRDHRPSRRHARDGEVGEARHAARHARHGGRPRPRPVRRATWALVQSSLADERITVAEDAARFGGQLSNGPLTAYYQADIIEKHALEGSGGKTYAELDREDPARASVMNGSFLRASLFTSIVSFGVAAMAMGLGIVFGVVGYALRGSAARSTPPDLSTPHPGRASAEARPAALSPGSAPSTPAR
jgi:hypothetical protein